MVPKKKKLLATGQAGFVSLESSTPERPVGTFVPSLGTPRRSPRLAAKRKRSRTHAESLPQPSVDRSAPVRSGLPPAMLEAVRTIAASRRCVELLDEVNSYVEYKYHDKQLDTSIVKAETSPNEIRRYVVVSRRLKAFDEAVGPHDSLRMVVGEDGGFRLLSYDKSLEEGVLTLPIVPTGDFHKAIEKLASERWVVCPGVKGYSTYKNSIGYDLKRVATSSWPPDTARDCECPVLYEKSSTKKSTLCSKCTSLKWRLAGRKREHEQYTSEHRLRSQASSTVPFDILSPESKKARLTNMRCEISTLRAKTRSNARMIDRIAVSDEQNDELFELIQSIKKSEDGQRELQSIFQEADSAGAGKGDILKSIWEQDVSDMTQFYKDQEQNGKSSVYKLCVYACVP